MKSDSSNRSLILAVTALIDRIYYGKWTVPPANFLYFNLVKSLAVFYGSNRWDYYFSEGIPLLLTSLLPFGILGIYEALAQIILRSEMRRAILGMTVAVVPLILSLISHKEVRFIYPLLPIIHVLAALPFTRFLQWSFNSTGGEKPTRLWSWAVRRLSVVSLVMISVGVALVASTSHQPGPLSVLEFLRQEYIKQYPISTIPPTYQLDVGRSSGASEGVMTVSFLMPCHSTPWRSHLIFPGIKAWALTCEPPLDVPLEERTNYFDEADHFYQDPTKWIDTNLGRPPLSRKEVSSNLPHDDREKIPWDGRPGRKMWTQYVVFFQQLESTMRQAIGNRTSGQVSGYRECWRGWNSWAHDDWRRGGDIVVWCLS